MKNSNKHILIFLLFILLVSIPLFTHLGKLPIQIWDESRLAINAYEMYKSGDYIVTHYNGSPDLWSTKPPLMIWIQVFFMKLLGVNELAVRMPSALAGLLTALAIGLFLLKQSKEVLFAFLGGLLLVLIPDYVQVHSTRTGDYDALLTFFLFLSAFSVFFYIESTKVKYLYLFFLFTTMAVLSKSIQGLMFLPGIGIYILYRKHILQVLKSPHFYIGLSGFLLVVGAYYLFREYKNEGYLLAVQENEILGRYTEVLDNNKHGFGFYFSQLSYWNIFIIAGLISGLRSKNTKIQNLTVFSFVMLFVYILIISFSETKCAWYDVPLYPFVAILTAVFLRNLMKQILLKKRFPSGIDKSYFPVCFIVVVLVLPYFFILKGIVDPIYYPKRHRFYEVTRYLQKASKGGLDIEGKVFVYDGYDPHNTFYIHALREQGIKIYQKEWDELQAFDRVFVSQDHLVDYITDNYNSELILEENNIKTYLIHGRKVK